MAETQFSKSKKTSYAAAFELVVVDSAERNSSRCDVKSYTAAGNVHSPDNAECLRWMKTAAWITRLLS